MTNIAISNKVVGVTLSGHQRLNRYTDEELVNFVERCKEQSGHWHVMFRHTGIAGARQKVFRVQHDPRFKKLPLEYKAIRTPVGLIDTAAHHVGGYVVAKYSKNKAKLETRTEYFLDLSALSEAKTIELLDAITSGTVFRIPPKAYSIGIGHVDEPDPEAEVFEPQPDAGFVSDETVEDVVEPIAEIAPPATGSDAQLEGDDDLVADPPLTDTEGDEDDVIF